jgi:hypothetical protein
MNPPPSLPSPTPIEPPTVSKIPSPGWSEPYLLSGIFSPSPAPSDPPPSLPTYLTSLTPEPSLLLPTYLTSPWPSVASSLTPLYTKARIFVSYHHRLDQLYYDSLSRSVSVDYEVLYDNSPERAKDSDDSEYIMRSLRENHIGGSSCTIVLCGEETRWRRYVDWEIEATLYKNHGLIGVLLPTCRFGPNGGAHKPDRLQDNIDSGYAVWINWQGIIQNGPNFLREMVALANERSRKLIRNGRQRMQRSGTPPWKKNENPSLFPSLLTCLNPLIPD